MTYEPVLETLARQFLLEHWQSAVASAPSAAAGADEDDAAVALATAIRPCCVSTALMRELLRMMSAERHRSAAELTDEIRQHIADHLFLDECGDPPDEPTTDATLDEQVRVMVDVLERVRREAIDRGLWSLTPATSHWFG